MTRHQLLQKRRALLLPGVAALLLMSVSGAAAARTRPHRRRMQADSSTQVAAKTMDDWKLMVDPATCALKQYSMSVALTAATLDATANCFETDGSVSPYVQLSIGGKTVRSKTEVATRNPVYLETFQLGCQDITSPLVVSVVNADNGKTCIKTNVEHWTYGRKGVFTDTQPAESDKARSGGFGIIKDTQQSYPYTIISGSNTLDLTINAFPGPQDEASRWNIHTAGDIVGIVGGMIVFVALLGMFVWKIRNSASGPAVAEAAALAATAAAPATGKDGEKKLGGSSVTMAAA